SNERILNIQVPALSSQLTDSPYDLNFTTVPQLSLNKRSLTYILDSMVFTQGSTDDYNRWARVTGDNGWS
ncbi:GMC oxidoreductase, partial [Sphaerobolus stellatus SS14]